MNRVVYCADYTDNFKFNSYTMNYIFPLNKENATSAVLLAEVLSRGCTKYGEMDKIIMKLQELYDASISFSCDKYGENLVFSICASYMSDQFTVEGEEIEGAVLDIVSSLLFDPILENGVFKEEFFTQEKKNLENRIKGIFNDKRAYSKFRCEQIMFENSSYSVSARGDLDTLKSLTNSRLYDFYQNLLKEYSCVINYIGCKTNLEEVTSKHFARILCGNTSDIVKTPLPLQTNIKYEEERCQVAQGKLCIGYRFVNETEYYAGRLFNVIFGGSPTSKLFMNVREKMSLCYYCSSVFNPYVHSMVISSGIEFDKFEVAKQEIFNQLEDMKNGNITDEEFENGKLYLIDYIKGISDSHDALLNEKLKGVFLNIHDDIDTQVQRIKTLDKEQIVAVAQGIRLDTVYFLKGKEA